MGAAPVMYVPPPEEVRKAAFMPDDPLVNALDFVSAHPHWATLMVVAVLTACVIAGYLILGMLPA